MTDGAAFDVEESEPVLSLRGLRGFRRRWMEAASHGSAEASEPQASVSEGGWSFASEQDDLGALHNIWRVVLRG